MSWLRSRGVVALATCLGLCACGIQLDSELEEQAKAQKSAEQVVMPEAPVKVAEKKIPEQPPAPGPEIGRAHV